MSFEQLVQRFKRSIYLDTNALIRLNKERQDLERSLTAKVLARDITVVPANEIQIYELTRLKNQDEWLGDLKMLHLWTRGQLIPSIKHLMRSYTEAAVSSSEKASTACIGWDVDMVLENLNEFRTKMENMESSDEEWARSIHGIMSSHAEERRKAPPNILASAIAQASWITRHHSARPDKVREFIGPYCDGVSLDDEEAARIGESEWYRFICAMRLLPICQRFSNDAAQFNAKRYGNDFRDWMHICYSRTARCFLTLDNHLVSRINEMNVALEIEGDSGTILNDWDALEAFLKDPERKDYTQQNKSPNP
ncbi:MAG: hypothetical protein R3F30_09020 [Planctomycetota bacterium]